MFLFHVRQVLKRFSKTSRPQRRAQEAQPRRVHMRLEELEERVVPTAGDLLWQTTTNFPGTGTQDNAAAVAIYPTQGAPTDGKIIVAGSTGTFGQFGPPSFDFGLAR